MPEISVIIPNYNYARYLPKRIDSILNQSYSDFELIILDDASTDNSSEIIESYRLKDKRIKTYFNKKNSGNTFQQWEKGVGVSSGEFIWIAEADDYCTANFLEDLKPYLEKQSIGLVFSGSLIIDEKGKKKGVWPFSNRNITDEMFSENKEFSGIHFIEKALIYENVIANASSAIFKRSILEKVGGIHTSLSTNFDWLLWLKMATVADVAYVHEPLNYFRRHSESVIAGLNIYKGQYTEKFDMAMRILYHNFLKEFGVKNSLISKINNGFISFDFGNKGLFQIDHKIFLKGWINVFRASFYPKMSTGFIKKAIKKCFQS